jgi:hypothetical protein
MEEKESRERFEALHADVGQVVSQLAEAFKILLSLAASLYIGSWIYAVGYFSVFKNLWLAGQVPVTSIPARLVPPFTIFIVLHLVAMKVRFWWWMKNESKLHEFVSKIRDRPENVSVSH